MNADTAVRDAIRRWLAAGLIDDELARRLSDELAEAHVGHHQITAQYFVAATAGLVLVTAGALFVGRSWPLLPMPARTLVLAIVAGFVLALGIALEPRDRLRPVAYLLQTSGMVLLLVTYMHAENSWEEQTLGGVATGLISLLTLLVATWWSIARNSVMPAVNAAIGYAFVAIFLDRIGVPGDTIVWILDGILLFVLGYLFSKLRQEGADAPTVLHAFIASMTAGFVLVGFTMAGPLDAGAQMVYPLDVWLIIAVTATLWGIHRAPRWLHRVWYIDLLAVSVLGATILAFATLAEIGIDGDWLGLGGGLVGTTALYYGLRYNQSPVILAACLALVISMWHFGISQAGSLGAVGALVVTAALLFWVSSRLGDRGSPNGSRGRWHHTPD